MKLLMNILLMVVLLNVWGFRFNFGGFIVWKFFIEGLVGKIEIVFVEFIIFFSGIVVVVYFYLLYGGIMDNKVVHIVFKSVLEFGYIVVKFNFCGIGNSEGAFDYGVGEVEDVVVVV